MKPNRPKQPRSGKEMRPTTLNLTPDLWRRLQLVEDETGAAKSVIVRRILDKHLPPPAA
jgi:hypothetical protein